VPFELVPGAVVAKRYQLERALGQGGMGVVWAATHTITRKKVALKFLKGPVHLRPELLRRFLREARAASAVLHPNVLEVHDVFELDDETPVMLMDLLEGETLGARIARLGKLSLSETADILIQVVSAVGTAHAVGVVHRDLKPDNVFLVGSAKAPPSVRVLDFGIAKLVGMEGPTAETGIITGTGSMVGTPCYMSPEQSYGEKAVDYRTDIWALGVIFYECLTGARPVEGESIGQVVKRLLSDGITPISVVLPSLPQDVATLIDTMLAREREQRTQDLREVCEVLDRYTSLRPPEFGAAESERPSSEAELPSQPSNASVDSSDTVRSTGSNQVPAGPETASTHTMSQARPSGRASRALWAGVAAVVVVGGAAVVVSRGTSDTASASGAPAAQVPVAAMPVQTATGVAPEVSAKVPVASPNSELAEPAVPPAPSTSAAPVDRRASSAGRPVPPGTRHGPASAASPPSSVAPPAPAPAPTTAPRTRVGGLAEKPPF
jgi:eukaryotic-like serine/threonine-protein kinase